VPDLQPGAEELLVQVTGHGAESRRLDAAHGWVPPTRAEASIRNPGSGIQRRGGRRRGAGGRIQGGGSRHGAAGRRGYAEQVVTHQRLAMRVPDALSLGGSGRYPRGLHHGA
jgi:hypothetical protein